MKVDGDYTRDGYAHVRELVPADIAQAFLRQLKDDVPDLLTKFRTHAPIVRMTTIDIYANEYPPMLQFLWGLTPSMRALTGRDLLPCYNYFRIYRQHEICRIHADRPACEHSLSLTLAYSDGMPWPFEVGVEPIEEGGRIDEDFGGAPYRSIAMQPGDAVLYRGVEHRHGRLQRNPNRWSAHMFLHWVDRDGPHAAHAFDIVAAPQEQAPGKVDFDI